jgi:hypothetical protein
VGLLDSMESLQQLSVPTPAIHQQLSLDTTSSRLLRSKSVFLAALWSDDEASIAVRFLLPETIPRDEFDRQVVIKAAEASERSTHNDTARLAA